MPVARYLCIFINVGLGETINLAAGALQKSQNGGDIPDKKQFARTIGAVTSTTITLGESGWFKIATVVMPQATSTAVIKLYGGAGFNAGSPEQAAISELVLRAGNGSPVGITATLWRRSPAAANEVAWVNTSGDTYDIYINIGQYAYWLIAQYDYTGNANVTLHSTPEYSSVQPGNSTSGQTYTIYSSLMKPTAGDVGALPITGGQLNGPLSIGTDNALGGNSIVLGDNDTGFKQNGDGILDTYRECTGFGFIFNHRPVRETDMQGIRRRRRRGVIAGINPRQNKRRVKFTAHGQNQHLLPHGRCPPCARTPGTTGQPLKPVGAHAAGLHTAATGVKVGFDDNAGAYHVAQCARELRQTQYSGLDIYPASVAFTTGFQPLCAGFSGVR